MSRVYCSLRIGYLFSFSFFFFNDTATTEIYTLSLHDALPTCSRRPRSCLARTWPRPRSRRRPCATRSEEHTSELQSRRDLVCRLLLEKKKKKKKIKERKKENKESLNNALKTHESIAIRAQSPR